MSLEEGGFIELKKGSKVELGWLLSLPVLGKGFRVSLCSQTGWHKGILKTSPVRKLVCYGDGRVEAYTLNSVYVLSRAPEREPNDIGVK